MVRFFIDGQEADVDRDGVGPISIPADWLTGLEEDDRKGRALQVKVPATLRNRTIIGDVDEIADGTFFNQQEHRGWMEVDGCRLAEGELCLREVEHGAEGIWFVFEIEMLGKPWANSAAEEMLRKLDGEFQIVLRGDTIAQSWTWDQAVRFLPVQRQEMLSENPDGNLIEPVRVLTVEDYHPFLHVRSLLEKMVGKEGYRIRSDFFDSELFNALYLSGNYIVHDVELLRSRMDFRAGRFKDAEAVTDRFGYVYAGQAASENSLGGLVDTADPNEVSDGASIEGVFDVGGCFGNEDGVAVFYPPQEVVLGFEYGLRYTTDTWLASREELFGINRVKLPGEEFRQFRIANRNVDRRGEYAANFSYLLVVFDYVEGESFQLRHDVVSDPSADLDHLKEGEFSTEVAAEFAARTFNVGTYTENRLLNPVLWVREGETFVPYQGDWALYDGYVTERGSAEIEFTVCSAPERLLPSQPKYFDRIIFAGPEQGMKMTLSKRTTLRPRFTANPGEGSMVPFEELAEHRVRQIKVIEAVKHLFNLYFYTDNRTKTLYIEPEKDFYRKDVWVDWSRKVDKTHPVVVEEIGKESHKITTLCYQEGDGAVDQWNVEHEEILGSWSREIRNRFAQKGEEIIQNPMATASIVKEGVYAEAPSVGFLQVGLRDQESEQNGENVNFPAKFVYYFGMKELPEGELWGWPGNGKMYPEMAFHRAASEGNESVSLLFEDRDGVEGLHRFYDIDFRRCDLGRKVTVWLLLEPQDMENLLTPNRLMRDFRALFRLGIGGENMLFRLESVSDDRPGKAAKCVFFSEV